MRLWVLFFAFLLCLAVSMADCPAGEYNPGPDCSFETICGLRSSHSYRRHYCDCWCTPPLIRDTSTNTCVLPDQCPN
ncbi:hypothetical protein O3G_MSEX011729 [Manduca sexta]|uniref:Uncharacterized protein n=1 Tax=Manduca sexta TaxID=7130 RepID=A0A921ZLJ3_MANSE|nr:hypothetical protein O3G_MSEX011729 [Manduca sexta]